MYNICWFQNLLKFNVQKWYNLELKALIFAESSLYVHIIFLN